MEVTIIKEKISVIIVGDQENEHTTYVKHDNKYYKFYTDGYDGIKSTEVILFLKFLEYEVFEVYRSNYEISKADIVNWNY